MNQLGLKRTVHLAAQTADGHIHDVAIAVEVHVPDLLGDERARQDLARVSGEQREQPEFFRGEVDAPAAPQHPMAHEIDLQVRDAHRLHRAGLPAAQEGAHAGEHLGEGEKLDQIVVCAQIQALDAVFALFARKASPLLLFSSAAFLATDHCRRLSSCRNALRTVRSSSLGTRSGLPESSSFKPFITRSRSGSIPRCLKLLAISTPMP
jgi:hypothetical protein